MKKIKITEKQASLLGLPNIKENEESGVKSVSLAMGELVIRVVIFGDAVPKLKDRILQIIAKIDPNSRVGFFEATGKIVGNVRDIKLGAIKRDLKTLDPSLSIEKKSQDKSLKEGVKTHIKITKEQYNRIFASNTITESENVKGGLNRVDKTFKKEFAGKPIQNLKPVAEDKFNITKPNKSVPKLTENEDQLKGETIELIKYLYRKSEDLSPFWEKNGLTYEDICDDLLTKKLIIKKAGKYELAKTTGSPQSAIQAVEDELRNLIGSDVEATAPEIETEASNLPAGAEFDSKAPWNQQDDVITPTEPTDPQLTVVAINNEVAILKGPDESLYVFYYDHIDKSKLAQYASLARTYVGRDEEGQPDYEYDDDFEVNDNVISHYVNDNLKSISKGEGLNDYESGQFDLVKIDEPLKNELANLYDKDKNMVKILGPIAEDSEAYDKFVDKVVKSVTPSEKPVTPQSKILDKLAELRAKENARRFSQKAAEVTAKAKADKMNAGNSMEEITGAVSSGAFTAPLGGDVVKRDMPEESIVDETTVASAGNFQYDAPAFANVGRNGEYKKGPKTKAQVKTQYAGGSFVETSGCVKLNNNKEAQNGKCSQGAVDGVVKQRKSSSSVISPSLDEGRKYELGKGYTHFAVWKKNNKIVDGWDYKNLEGNKDDIKYYSSMDLKDNFPDVKPSDFKVVGKAFLLRNNIDPSDTNNWNHEPVTNENAIYEEIANKTGRTIDEVKKIIASKKKA